MLFLFINKKVRFHQLTVKEFRTYFSMPFANISQKCLPTGAMESIVTFLLAPNVCVSLELISVKHSNSIVSPTLQLGNSIVVNDPPDRSIFIISIPAEIGEPSELSSSLVTNSTCFPSGAIAFIPIYEPFSAYS